MNITSPLCAALLATAVILPCASAASKQAAAPPTATAATAMADMDGLFFKGYRYVTLKVQAYSMHYSVDEEYDHQLVIRFDSKTRKVDVRLLDSDGVEVMSESGSFTTNNKPTGEEYNDANDEGFAKGILHYQSPNIELNLHVATIVAEKPVKKTAGPSRYITLVGSNYVYYTGTRVYENLMAEHATLEGSNE